MMRGDQLSRQWLILRRIESSKRGLTAAEIADLLKISLRTAYRDLDDLQHAGFPLYAEQGENGQRWKFVDTYRFKVPHPFSFTEIMALHLSRDFFKIFRGTIFYDSLASLFKKVQASLPAETMIYLDHVRSVFHVGIKPYKKYERFREIINQVYQAAVDRCSIEIMYKPLRSQKETVRKINPYKISFSEGTIYVIGYCHLRNDVRTFVLDRIKLLSTTQETFELPDDLDLDAYTKDSFRVMNDELFEVKIMISPDWSRYVGEKIWHESQTLKKLPGGSLEITFKVAGLDEIKQWVMGFGPEAIVLAPDKLKEMVVSGLKKSLAQYKDTGSVYRHPPEKRDAR
ncbi:MAG: YafY family transcriptional regulator [Deltaproteobacteria bacterium]|nr:YafY family transcriptional regulator [Deltaproteobacteria bacterium]